MKTILVTTLAVALAASSPLAAVAKDKGKHKGHPHPASGHAVVVVDKPVPPGLARIPPGQAKKMWYRGQRLPEPYYVSRTYYIIEPVRYRLAPPPFGYRWVRVGNDAYLVQTETGLISDLVRALF